ncbi:hypothetical protein GUJ93_ZPchr0007g5170 [Zizania palustris]|uniref:F-box domain-containing protein n=1 Tax=Zizania palustris TaxID=103762 RepID=A0A8J5W6I6_ZIZPA|nr:hypothetical protein GUJ93_ZPchr0007g5170 [Zizania palustris]
MDGGGGDGGGEGDGINGIRISKLSLMDGSCVDGGGGDGGARSQSSLIDGGDNDGDNNNGGGVVGSELFPIFGDCDGGDGDGGCEIPTKRNGSPSIFGNNERVDIISTLPDDILHVILQYLSSTTVAAKIGFLSKSWFRLWSCLPHIWFPLSTDLARVAAAITANVAPVLHGVVIVTEDVDAEAIEGVFSLAARRVYGNFIFNNNRGFGDRALAGPNEVVQNGDDAATVWFPCFEMAVTIYLQVRSLWLALPQDGVFAGLTNLNLEHVQFRGGCELGDMVSSTRCPKLRTLYVHCATGLVTLTVRSESLTSVDLEHVFDLQEVTIEAAMLTTLSVVCCFVQRQPEVNISAPRLHQLTWKDVYDPTTIRLSSTSQLMVLSTCVVLVQGLVMDYGVLNSVKILESFKSIYHLDLALTYHQILPYFENLMEWIKCLPDAKILTLSIMADGHAFASCVFHLLKFCARICRLDLTLFGDLQVKTACPVGCICSPNWQTEEIQLRLLQDIKVNNLRGEEIEFVFLTRLLGSAPSLQQIELSFNASIPDGQRPFQKFLALSSLKNYKEIYRNVDQNRVVYAPVAVNREITG